jgi:tetratricopeptide (TPR) repeat protein
MRLFHCLYVLALLALPAPLFAQADGWTGQTIVMKKIKTPIGGTDANGQPVVVAVLDEPSFQVLGEQNNMVNIKTRHGRGLWFAKTAAVLLVDAEDYFSEQHRLDRKDTAALLGRATARTLRGRNEDALEDLDRAIAADPAESALFTSRGLIWLKRKNYKKALADFTEAIRHDPKNAVAHTQRGNAYLGKGDFALAKEDCSEAIRLDRNYLLPYLLPGNARRALRESGGALMDYSEVIRIDPADVRGHFSRARIYQDQKNYGKAIADCKEAQRLAPDNAGILNQLAWLLAVSPQNGVRNGRLAVKLAHRACELTRWKNANMIETLAAAHAEEGDFKEAVRYEQRAIDEGNFTGQRRRDAENRLRLYRQRQRFHLSWQRFDSRSGPVLPA